MLPSPLQCFAAGHDQPTPQHFALAIYGGAFDPPHAGHASVIRRVLDSCDQVLVVPSYQHADGKRMADFDLRCAGSSAWPRASVIGYAAAAWSTSSAPMAG